MFGKAKRRTKIFSISCLLFALSCPAMAWEFAPDEMTMAVGAMGSLMGGLTQNPAFQSYVQERGRSSMIHALEDLQAEIFEFKSCISGLRESIARNSLTKEILSRSSSDIQTGVRSMGRVFSSFCRMDFFRAPQNRDHYKIEIERIEEHLRNADSIIKSDLMGDLERALRDRGYIVDKGFLLDGLILNLTTLDGVVMNLKNMLEHR